MAEPEYPEDFNHKIWNPIYFPILLIGGFFIGIPLHRAVEAVVPTAPAINHPIAYSLAISISYLILWMYQLPDPQSAD